MADLAVGDIIKNITDDVKLLVQDQIELAKTELTPAAKLGGTGAGLFGAAGYFALSATIILYFAAAFGLVAAGLAAWLAFLIVARRLLLIAGILAGIGLPDRQEDQGTGANHRPGQSDGHRGPRCGAARTCRGERTTDRGPGRPATKAIT